MPIPKFKNYYSLAWGGIYPGEQVLDTFKDFSDGLGVK